VTIIRASEDREVPGESDVVTAGWRTHGWSSALA